MAGGNIVHVKSKKRSNQHGASIIEGAQIDNLDAVCER